VNTLEAHECARETRAEVVESCPRSLLAQSMDHDPVVGRWTSKDPIGFSGGQVNLYAYARLDPINRLDTTGKFDEQACHQCLEGISHAFHLCNERAFAEKPI